MLMALKDNKEESDIEAVQIWSAKELDAEFAAMQEAYRDKETEYNWEARDKALTRLRGILRGNASDKYHDSLMLGVRQMVDGILKAVESLRTSLALNALALVADIGIYLGKSLDTYIYDRLMDCLMKCASTTKKVIAQASMKTTITFITHASYHHKVMNMLWMTMNEKNNQARLYTVLYTKAILQAHTHRDQTRALMDRTGGTEVVMKILNKGLSDATPAVRESCREAFWIFAEHWKDRGEVLLKSLQPTIRKALEKTKTAAKRSQDGTSRTLHSPTNSSSSLKTSSSMGSHRNIYDIHDAVSPSTSSASNGSAGSTEHHPPPHDISRMMTRSISPRASSPSIRSTSPHLLRTYGSPPPVPSHLHASYMPPPPTSPPPPATRKTRVPTLGRKKSTIGTRRKLSLMAMLNNDELTLRCDGLHALARKLSAYPYSANPDLKAIEVDTGSGTVDGESLKTIVWDMFHEDNARLYEVLSSWEGVAGVLLKLVSFDEYIPQLILDASADAVTLKTEDDIAKYDHANLALKRAKLFLRQNDEFLAERLLAVMEDIGGFGSTAAARRQQHATKTPNPANRRKLSSQLLQWMDELVTPILGLESSLNNDDLAVLLQGSEEWISSEAENVVSQWFESDVNVRQCLEKLLPLVSTSSSGSIVHAPLTSLVGHLRLVNQKLFETVAASYDNNTVNKISRVLGIHIRAIPDYVCQAGPPAEEPTELDLKEEEESPQPADEEVVQSVYEEVVEEEEEEEQQKNVGEEEQEVELSPAVDDVVEPAKPQKLIETSPAPAKLDLPPEPDEHSDSPAQEEILSEPSYASSKVAIPSTEEYASSKVPIPPTTEEIFRPFDRELDMKELTIPVAVPMNNAYSSDTGASLKPERSVEQHQPQVNGHLDDDSTPSSRNRTADRPTGLVATEMEDRKRTRPPITNVPYFAPKEVVNPLGVFRENRRSTTTTETGATTNGHRGRDRTTALYTLIDKLKSMTADNATIRKLIRMSREWPVVQFWDQSLSNDTAAGELWAGANQDGGNFVELVQGTLLYLDPSKGGGGGVSLTAVLELVRQLLVSQVGLFKFYERKVDDQGMSLEARLIERLLVVRASDDATVSIAAEDTLDTMRSIFEAYIMFEVLSAYLTYRLVLSPLEDDHSTSRYHPVGSAFTYLGKCVKDVDDAALVDEWVTQGSGIDVFVKGFNHPMVHVRKSCVETIVEFHGVMGDELYQFLDELRPDQLNLVRHYVGRAVKTKSSFNSLRSTPTQL